MTFRLIKILGCFKNVNLKLYKYITTHSLLSDEMEPLGKIKRIIWIQQQVIWLGIFKVLKKVSYDYVI